jgi:tetratricopeptide (TPR) repeat protein
MKKIIIALLFIGTALTGAAQDKIQQANEVYTQGDFNQAVELYLQVIESDGASANVYYNIGNSYFRLNKIAPAILYYERAILLLPGDPDIRFNLELARLKTVDKIEPVGEFFLTDWYNDLKNLFSAHQWSYIAITCFILLIGCLVLFFFSRKILLKKTGFYSGLIFVVFIVLANLFAYSQKKKLTDRKTAIIFASTVTIKSSPDNSGTDLFILHEGAKVDVKRQLGEWDEIETANGNVGWIKRDQMEII